MCELSAVPEESSCLNSERGSNSSPVFQSTCSLQEQVRGSVNNKSVIDSDVVTLEDFEEDPLSALDRDKSAYVAETELNERTPTPKAWLHNPSACSTPSSIQSNPYNKRNRINYRDLPPRRGIQNTGSRQQGMNSNRTNHNNGNTMYNNENSSNTTQPPPPYDSGEGRKSRHWTPRNGQRRPGGTQEYPTFVQVTGKDNRVTTKIKTTLMMEVEYSHPNVPNFY